MAVIGDPSEGEGIVSVIKVISSLAPISDVAEPNITGTIDPEPTPSVRPCVISLDVSSSPSRYFMVSSSLVSAMDSTSLFFSSL